MTPAPINAVKPKLPQSFGWLRRPELDQDFDLAWEQPDGTIRRIPRQHDLVLSMDCRGVKMVLTRQMENAGNSTNGRGLIARCLDRLQHALRRSPRSHRTQVAGPGSRGAQGHSRAESGTSGQG